MSGLWGGFVVGGPPPLPNERQKNLMKISKGALEGREAAKREALPESRGERGGFRVTKKRPG